MLENRTSEADDEELVLKIEKDPLIGKTIGGRYEILSVLGRGGMGSVYRANQTDIDRPVAVKILHMSRIIDTEIIRKFRSEAQAVSRVRHPNSVLLYDFGVSDEGVPFLAMELLEGITLRKLLKDHGPLNPVKANRIFSQTMAALSFAHSTGVVHKDLKPENIMLSERQGQTDWVHVLDFGIAGLLEGQSESRQEIVGSPPYMSPEQCSGQKNIDHRSDIYSLGVCIFEALSGKFPFKARTAIEMMECHISAQPLILKELETSLSRYESVSQVILKAMEKGVDKRQQSVDELAAELGEAIVKDSRRGIQLRDRATLEIDAPIGSDFVESKVEDLAEEQEKRTASKPMTGNVKNNVQKDEIKSEQGEDSDPKYHFSNCPHCGEKTQEGLSLCLSCGRSLANKDDFSKIRMAKGEFSLPKIQELGAAGEPRNNTQRMRIKVSGNDRLKSFLPIIISICLLLVLCVFVFWLGPETALSTVLRAFKIAR